MHHDTSAAQGLLRTIVVERSVVTPDLDAESVGVVVISRDHELVTALSIDRAFTLELRLVTCHHQPFVTGAVEVQVARFELELGVAIGYVCALLVFGNETESGFARHG